MKYLFVAINSKYIHSNLGIYSIVEYLRERDIVAQQLEFTINQPLLRIVGRIYEEQPDFLGISVYIWNVEIVSKLVSHLEKIMPNTRIWVGGPEVSYSAREFLIHHTGVEGVICGEGEETVYQLLHTWNLPKIAGIAYRNYETGEIVVNEAREELDMNQLPFVYKHLEDFQHRIIYYESSRGCPFGCSYCLSCISSRVRFRDIEQVKKELAHFLSQRVAQVKFVDRTFNCNPARTLELLEFIQQQDNGITNFHMEIAADLLTKQQLDVIAGMRPGLIQMEIGVQSTCEKTLKAIHRSMDIQRLQEVVKALDELGNVHIHLDLIAGLPYENLERFKQSFNDVYQMKPEQLQLGFLKVLKGSPLANMAQEYGMIYQDIPPYEILSTRWLSYGDLLELKQTEAMVELYYNSGQYRYSLRYLLEYYESPYEFYAGLGAYYERNGYMELQQSRQQKYLYLYEYVIKQNRLSDEEIEIFQEILNFDLYLRERGKSRLYFAYHPTEQEQERAKEKIREMHLPNSVHVEWIQGKSLAHMGMVKKEDTILAHQRYMAIFDYRERNPLNYEATYWII